MTIAWGCDGCSASGKFELDAASAGEFEFRLQSTLWAEHLSVSPECVNRDMKLVLPLPVRRPFSGVMTGRTE